MFRMSLAERLQHYEPVPFAGCWIWMGKVNKFGYGSLYWQGRERIAHRLLYETVRGPVAAGLQLDHLCRVRCCVNPAHLEPVTPRENVRRARRDRQLEKAARAA